MDHNDYFNKSGDHCLTELSNLPKEARILATGNNLQEIQQDSYLFSEVSKSLSECKQ
jgi:hypothetical protein